MIYSVVKLVAKESSIGLFGAPEQWDSAQTSKNLVPPVLVVLCPVLNGGQERGERLVNTSKI